MTDPTTIADLARELEQIEDELTHVTGMEDFQDRISQVRMALVDHGLEQYENDQSGRGNPPADSDEPYAEFADASTVAEALDLAGEPAFVEMVGRNVKFTIPGGEKQ